MTACIHCGDTPGPANRTVLTIPGFRPSRVILCRPFDGSWGCYHHVIEAGEPLGQCTGQAVAPNTSETEPAEQTALFDVKGLLL